MPTRTQEIFQNTANLSLRGNTYDAKHLDQFLTSAYGEKSLNQDRQNRSTAQFNNETGKQTQLD